MNKIIKNLTESIKTRLLNISKENNREFNSVLIQYFQERFLYRLSISEYCSNFILKGALMLIVYDDNRFRPTKDIDFLGTTISNKPDELLRIFKEIIEIEYDDDGISFDSNSLTIEEINNDGDYDGQRIKVDCSLGKIKSKLQIDIGFGDIIIEGPLNIDFPVLLDFPHPKIQIYSKESAIAEKFEAIISLGNATSRLKDFYDIIFYAKTYSFDSESLKLAVHTTFKTRNTSLEDVDDVLESIKEDNNKQIQWESFLSRNGLVSDTTFQNIINQILAFLHPIYQNEKFDATWENNMWINN
jgi:predicted nucleotidyltransferase component of viral defense system